MDFVITGQTKAAQQLLAAAQSGSPALASALFQEAEIIMTAAKQDFVPVDTGALRASGFVEPPLLTPTGASITLGFGGPAAPYAVIVHEDLTKRHPVGQAKYLELPVKARLAGMPAVLAMRVTDVTRQAIQQATKVSANLAAGRRTNWGMPLFGES